MKKAAENNIIFFGVDWMKKKKNTVKILVAALCIIALAAGTVFAVRYIKTKKEPRITGVLPKIS